MLVIFLFLTAPFLVGVIHVSRFWRRSGKWGAGKWIPGAKPAELGDCSTGTGANPATLNDYPTKHGARPKTFCVHDNYSLTQTKKEDKMLKLQFCHPQRTKKHL